MTLRGWAISPMLTGRTPSGFHKAYGETLNTAGDTVDAAKSRLEHLDWEAHEEIAQLNERSVGFAAARNAIIASYNARAVDACERGGAEIAALGKDLPRPPAPGAHERPGSAHPGPMYQPTPWRPHSDDDHIFAAGNGDENPPTGRGEKQPENTSNGAEPSPSEEKRDRRTFR